MATRRYRSKQYGQSEEELSKKFIRTMLGIIGLVVFVILALFVFAPTFGSAFGLLSKNRNAKEEVVTVRIRPPTLTNVPTATKETKINLAGYANESETGETFTIILDTEAPKIEVDSPKNDSTVRNLDKRITIVGKVSEKSTLKINGR